MTTHMAEDVQNVHTGYWLPQSLCGIPLWQRNLRGARQWYYYEQVEEIFHLTLDSWCTECLTHPKIQMTLLARAIT